MFGNSAPVTSNQSTPAATQRLARLIRRHLQHDYLKPVSDHNRRTFLAIESIRRHQAWPVILDSGCGNGVSSQRLAQENPRHLVIGIDKSAHRLRGLPLIDDIYHERNLVIARAELGDVWRLAAASGWRLRRHLIYYPNPWPKQKHLMRRWYAHPVMPGLLCLGGQLEVRSNWRTYLDEFSTSLATRGIRSSIGPLHDAPGDASPFERKYRASGHRLYRLQADLQSGCL